MVFFYIIYLQLIILVFTGKSSTNKESKRNLGIILPPNPDSPSTSSPLVDTTQDESKPISSSVSRTTNFSDIWKNYYKENITGNNEYLEYPEPLNGWEYDLCQNSGEQSPINIPYETDLNIIKDRSNVQILSINYNYIQSGSLLYQQNHAWGIGIVEGGNIRVTIESKTYTFYLSEIYIHLNSEHRLQNKQYPLEIELVHYYGSSQETIEKLIISVLFDYSNNKANDFINTLNIRNGLQASVIDFSDIVSNSKPFYYYKGSLTIPPCSTNVHRIIFKDVLDMSFSQFENIRMWIENSNKYFYGRGYGNARGIKPLNGRRIYYESKNITNRLSSQNINNINSDDSGNFMKNKIINLVNIIILFDFIFALF